MIPDKDSDRARQGHHIVITGVTQEKGVNIPMQFEDLCDSMEIEEGIYIAQDPTTSRTFYIIQRISRCRLHGFELTRYSSNSPSAYSATTASVLDSQSPLALL